MDPTSFGQYRIIRKLSGGGMGRVYLAEEAGAGSRPIALKLIDVTDEQESREVIEAERRGAVLQKQFAKRDSRVAQIYDHGEREGHYYIAMEFVPGQDLSQLLVAGALPTPEAVRIAVDLCEVLDKAHRFQGYVDGQEVRGIIHGDIKPRNIRITPDHQIKLLDFGIAKAISVTRKYTRNQWGSTAYSSPERLLTGDVDAAADVWAAGVVLFEMLTGKRYFQADQESRLEALIRRYNEVAPLPDRIPRDLQLVLRRALSPDPAARYESAADLAGDLRTASQDESNDASPTVGHDVDATRRTSPPRLPQVPAREAATRRSSAPLPPPLPPVIRPVGAKPTPPPSRTRGWVWVRTALQVGLLGVVGVTGYSQVRVWREADSLQRDIETEHLKDLDAAWKRYQELADRNRTPFALSGVRRALRERLEKSADQVITDFRDNDQTVVRVAQWQRADDLLQHALEMNPSDKHVKGKLRLCQGHLARINITRTNLGQKLNEAKQDFEEARELMPKSPDPYVGLARLYLVNYHDVDRGEEALRQADRNGHSLGRREKALLADSYAYRADQLIREARGVRGMPQERDYLDRADQDYRRAEELCQQVAPYGDTGILLRRVHASRERLSQQRDQINRSGL